VGSGYVAYRERVMIWIFALGVLTLCVFSKGFRKFTIITAAVFAVGIGGVVAYFAYQDHILHQEAAAAETQARIREAKLPACVGKDQSQAFLESGGKCRVIYDPEIIAAFPNH
jgi:hypothetical protein